MGNRTIHYPGIQNRSLLNFSSKLLIQHFVIRYRRLLSLYLLLTFNTFVIPTKNCYLTTSEGVWGVTFFFQFSHPHLRDPHPPVLMKLTVSMVIQQCNKFCSCYSIGDIFSELFSNAQLKLSNALSKPVFWQKWMKWAFKVSCVQSVLLIKEIFFKTIWDF